ncbi:MAG TPA: hypothetical protein VIL68_07315 [Propionibacteriaceae bacterium]
MSSRSPYEESRPSRSLHFLGVVVEAAVLGGQVSERRVAALLEVAENRREESFHIGHVVKHQLAHRQVERRACG